MTVVLDSHAILSLAFDEKKSPVGAAIENEVCYMSPLGIAETYQLIYTAASKELAHYWFEFLVADTDDVRVEPDNDRKLLELVNDALRYGVPTGVAFSAALARKKKAAVLTNQDSYADLVSAGFCEVRKF